MVKLRFFGAARQVTGSRYYLEVNGSRILIDCGMFQERDYQDRNWEASPVSPKKIDAILLTHAHLDHCGLLPKLVHEGYHGPIFTTAPSAELAELILRDSAHIQAEDAAFKRKRHSKEGRRGKYPELPLYDLRDVDRVWPLFETVPYLKPVTIHDGVSATFHDAGHILGSAVVEVMVHHDGQDRRILFSGDLGQRDMPILNDPTDFHQADYLVLESTYGDRDHERKEDVQTQMANVINETIQAGGNVVIPTFAVERAQELMFHISQLVHQKRIPRVPIFLDSPMAIHVTGVFERYAEYLDGETRQLIQSGQSPLRFPGLKMVGSAEESKAINDLTEPAIIMASSGMCTAGRVKHHLRHNIKRPESTILFVGFQVRGTLGRQILDGNREVRIHGILWPVRARVAQIHGFSGHADRSALLRWLSLFRKPPRQLFLTHGEEPVALGLAEEIRQQMHWPVTVPKYLQAVDLT
jgi:metallo-beta-lactamase family protein